MNSKTSLRSANWWRRSNLKENKSTEISPLSEKNRIRIIDTIRGLAVLGILLANIIAYSFPGWEGASVWTHAKTSADYAFLYFISIFIGGKFFSLFSILFGFGLSIQYSRVKNPGNDYIQTYRRRLLILFIIGIIHGIFLYPGDILAFYALIGAIAFLFRNKSPVYLKRAFIYLISLAILILFLSIQLFPSLLGDSEPEWKSLTQQRQVELKKAGEPETDDLELYLYQLMSNEERLNKQGPFWGLFLYQGVVYLGIGFPLRLLLVTWRCLPLFLLGMYFYKKGVFNDATKNRSTFRRWVISGLPLGIILHLIAGGIQMSGVNNIWTSMILAIVIVIGPLLMVIGYMGMAVLLSRFNLIDKIYNSIAAVGRMALTNYLFHSIVAGFLFRFYGLALYGDLQPLTTLWIALAIFILQMVISTWWLKYFNFGPFEWIWRKWTYRTLLPIKK